ncbi:hypothetical protein BON30_47020 [Cystobacter ferrugineus]|uniref:Uncharacterized protein n=1 Tax=Cystobacter ferrugineus TaxID=83449 RepID=A0A1L9AUS7_9BACT|nr:hypothetical protein BON30_47020 [Cystobacter ferrugineus]
MAPNGVWLCAALVAPDRHRHRASQWGRDPGWTLLEMNGMEDPFTVREIQEHRDRVLFLY